MSRPDPWAPLRLRDFRLFFLASSINTLGSTMAPVALAFAVLHVSDSPSALGIVLASNTIPMVLFLLYGGVIADRLPRTLILRVGASLATLTQGTAAALVITGHAQLWMLAALEALNGITQAVLFPAFASITPQLVPKSLLQEANVLQSISRGALRVLGPTFAAFLVVAVGPGWALGLDALTWLLAVLVLRVKLPTPVRAVGSSMIGELREGWDFFRHTTWLWLIVIAFGILNAISSGAWLTLGPVRAKETFGIQGWGYLLSAESIGLLAIMVVMMRRRLERPLLIGMIGTAFFGIPIFLLGVHPQLEWLLPAAFLAGAGLELFGLGWTLAMQEHIDERMLSRAYSYDALGSFVAMPVGQLAYGPLAVAFGFHDVFVVTGVVYTAVALLCLLDPTVRSLRRTPVEVAA